MVDSKHTSALLKILKRIPVFDGLSPTQLQSLIGLCGSRSLQNGDALFLRGDASDHMFVLLSGAIALLRKDGIEMARFEPVSPLGEVGIVSGRPRQVTARSVGPSTLLVVPRKGFHLLLNDDLRMAATFYRNLVGLVSARIDEDSVRAFEHEELRSQLLRIEAQLELAFEAIAEGGLDVDAVRSRIDASLREALPTILIVDDEVEVLQFLSRALSEYDVVTAGDGVEALAAAEAQPPNLVISDVNMPNMDGLALLAKLKENRPDLPVIGLSGYVKADKAGQLGFDDFVLKPMRVAALRNTVKAQLASHA